MHGVLPGGFYVKQEMESRKGAGIPQSILVARQPQQKSTVEMTPIPLEKSINTNYHAPWFATPHLIRLNLALGQPNIHPSLNRTTLL